jgi:hypothetical protein
MAGQNEEFKQRLERASELDLSVRGRKSGRTITQPVWFVWEPGAGAGEGTLYLLPYKGADTQWYKNALINPTITLQAGTAKAECRLVPIADAAKVAAVAEMFRGKYGAGNVKTYYLKLDIAAIGQL